MPPSPQTDIPWVVLIATIVITIISLGLVILFLVFQNKRQLYFRNTQLMRDQFEQTLLKSQLEIQEQTVKHIGRELHDNLGQIASIIKINLTTLRLPETETVAREKVEDSKELLKQMIQDIKSLSASLNSDRISKLGLYKVLEQDIARINRGGELEAVLTGEPWIEDLDDNKLIIIYRMSQEILNNMVRHSQAKRIRVDIQSGQNSLILNFTDDGIGFDPEESFKKGGSGLLNLQNRARMIDADFSINSSPGNGTLVTISLPLKKYAAATPIP